ncbi:hypothetical protein GGR56DRAFT_84351 [Xylariaceae sp. FL0804]|nr:hypothetical protein GGR56DRAFT_84351 [Xylariaceae sp. FL0804]
MVEGGGGGDSRGQPATLPPPNFPSNPAHERMGCARELLRYLQYRTGHLQCRPGLRQDRAGMISGGDNIGSGHVQIPTWALCTPGPWKCVDMVRYLDRYEYGTYIPTYLPPVRPNPVAWHFIIPVSGVEPPSRVSTLPLPFPREPGPKRAHPSHSQSYHIAPTARRGTDGRLAGVIGSGRHGRSRLMERGEGGGREVVGRPRRGAAERRVTVWQRQRQR